MRINWYQSDDPVPEKTLWEEIKDFLFNIL